MVCAFSTCSKISKTLSLKTGQALTESLLLIPIIAIIIIASAWFANILLTQQELLIAARYGTDLIVNTNMDANSIRNEIKKYLCSPNVKGRRLDPAVLTDDKISVTISREQFSLEPKIYLGTEVEQNSSYVEISYDFRPLLLPFYASNSNQNRLKIYARSELLAGTRSEIERR